MEKSTIRTCLNCSHPVDHNYCSNCGQKSTTERFDLKYLWRNLIHSFDIDRGVFHTLWLLITRPGHAIREYVKGHRIGFSNPLKLFIITGAIATIITFEFHFFDGVQEDAKISFNLPEESGYYHYSSKYFSFFSLTAIPFFAFFSWIFFWKKRVNYIENLILNIYIAVGQFMVLIVVSPIMLLDEIFILWIYGPLNFIYNFWVIVTFFKSYTFKGVLASFVAIGIPQMLVYLFNYGVYRISPQQFWLFLDRVLN